MSLHQADSVFARNRYGLTKIVEEIAVRELAALLPQSRTNVTITMVAPGLCSTGLGRDARTLTKILHETMRALVARTSEVGSRTILHGLVVGEEGHGKWLSGCQVKEHWQPAWVSNEAGKKFQKKFWDELVVRLEEKQPGCIERLSSL